MRLDQELVVPFEGDGAGVAELAWGQCEIWQAMRRQGSWLPIGFTKAVTPGTTVADVVAELRFYLCRYQSMRTRLRFAEDGRAQQVVSAAGAVTMQVYDAQDDDPGQVAAQVEARYRAGGLDYVTDWPVRMAVICRAGRPTHLVMIACHLVSDGFGAMVMMDEFAARDPATGLAREPVTALEPMAQARWQCGPAGQRQSELAMRYWAGLLRSIAPRRFTDRHDERTPRHWTAWLSSPASYLATRLITARAGLDSSYVLLAACAIAQARVTGVNPVVLRVVVSNRFRPGLGQSVSPINQTGLCVIDVADGTFDEVLTRAWRRAMGSYKHAYYDPLQLVDLLAQVSRERGEEIDVGCFFNDRRMGIRDEDAAPLPTPEQVRSARADTVLRWDEPTELPVERFFAHIQDGAGVVQLNADTRYFPPDDMAAFLHGMEQVLVDAALDPDARSTITPAGRSAP